MTQPEALPVIGQELDRRTPAVAEDKDGAAEGVVAQRLAHAPRQAIDATAEVRRGHRDLTGERAGPFDAQGPPVGVGERQDATRSRWGQLQGQVEEPRGRRGGGLGFDRQPALQPHVVQP